MPALRERIVQDDFSVGMIRDVAPQTIDPRATHDIINGLLDKDGSVYKRGGSANKSNAAFGSSLRWLWDGYFDAGQRTVFASTADFGVLDSDDATPVNLGSDGISGLPPSAAMLEGLLFIGSSSGSYIYAGSRKTANYSTTTSDTTVTNGSTTVSDPDGGFTANVDAGMLMQVGSSERLYPVASVGSDTSLTLREAYEGSTSATANVTFYPIYKVTASDPYEESAIYAVCGNRLLVASGNRLKFSNVPDVGTGRGNPHVFTSTDYYDFPDGAQILGIATIDATALIFTTAGLWSYQGLPFTLTDAEGNPQHRVELLSRELILLNQSGLYTYQQSVLAPCIDGIYLLDGSSRPRRVSHPIDSLYREHVAQGHRAGQPAVFESHYFLPILSASASNVMNVLVARLDRPIDVSGQPAYPWTRIREAGGQVTAYALRVLSTATAPRLLAAENASGARVLDCTAYLHPEAAYKQDADGSNFTFSLVTRDFETGGLTTNHIRSIATRAEIVDAASDNPTIIFDRGAGIAEASSHLWDDEYWDDLDGDSSDGDLVWVEDDDDVYSALSCTMPESDGLDPYLCRVGPPRARLVRFRLRNLQPASLLRLRSFQINIRPSKAVRR